MLASSSLLFVDGSNVIRSPMAAAIAPRVLGVGIQADSAGTHIKHMAVSNEATKVIATLGIDISQHRPKSVGSIALFSYDLIVALSPSVALFLRSQSQLASDTVIGWNVLEPSGKNVTAYRECLDQLRSQMATLFPILEKRNPLTKSLNELRAYVDGALTRIGNRELDGSHLFGVASRSADLLEEALRHVLKFYLAEAALNYEEQVKKLVNFKSLDRLTMGEVLQAIRTCNVQFTQAVRLGSSKGAAALKNRRLFTKALDEVFRVVVELRNEMHHRHHIYSKNEVVLLSKSTALLSHLRDIINDPLFLIPTEVDRARALGRTKATS